MSKNKMKLELSGFTELLERIQKAHGDIDQAAKIALEEGAKPFTLDLKAGIQKHHRTGLTEKALSSDPRVSKEGNRLSLEVGFDMRHGGLPALFIEYGTPKMKPDPFIQPAIKRNQSKARKIQEQTLLKILEGLQK